MIKGVHAMFYTPQADEVREFLRDKLQLPFTELHEGWLIFDVSEVEVGCHPSNEKFHQISFYCDDIVRTVDKLKERGVTFTSGIKEEDWGSFANFRMPGDLEVLLYQPKYKKKPKKAAKPRKAAARPRKAKKAKRRR